MSRVGVRGRVTRSLVAFAVLGLLAGCGGGSDTSDASARASGGAKDAKTLAALAIIDRDTSVRPVGTAAYRGGNEGEGLGVGDSIQTSATGFAEVAYFDGSLTRVDRSGQFTLTTLDNTTGARRVEGSLVGGRAWNRVAKATGSNDQFEIDTPVATAAVRGTAFSIDCTATDACIFTIVEGTVEITPNGGAPILVTAPARITIQRNTPPPAPTTIDNATINADPWIVKNTTRDTTTGKTPATTTTSSTTSTTTTTTAAPTTTARAPAPTNPPAPPSTTPPTPAALTLDLNGTWNGTVEYTISQATGCFVGLPLTRSATVVLVSCGQGSILGVPYSTSATITCSSARCVTEALGDPANTRFTRTSPSSIAVQKNDSSCLAPPNGAGQAQLSADGSVLTFITVFTRCVATSATDMVQIVGSWTLTRG